MRTSAQGSLATVLLLIPILAVPMLAIFGVPQFTPVVASPFDDAAASRRQDESEAPPFSPTGSEGDPFERASSNLSSDVPEWGDEPSDRAARALADRRRVTPVSHRPTRKTALSEPTEPSPFASPSEGTAAPTMPDALPGSYRRQRNTAVVDTRPNRPTAEATPAMLDPQLTWRDAVQKLNALGIRNFRLEPGHQPSQFLFSCSYTPRDNPSVSYRFENEADEPLRAVERVLEQIDTWLAAR